jgi:hypothetical protein
MSTTTSKLQQTAMNAGTILYCAAVMSFGFTLQLLEKTDHYSGTMYAISIVSWGVLTVCIPLFFAMKGRALRHAARQA